MKTITTNENTIFLTKVECFRKGDTLYAPVHILCRVTKMSRNRFFRFLHYNRLVIDDTQKRVRKSMKAPTEQKVNYIRTRIAEKPDITLGELGRELNCSKQSVNQLITRYGIEKM